jgi:aminoglycoside/choline kinase family phosphotransferase
MKTIPGITELDASWLASQLILDGDFQLATEPIGSGQVASCHRLTLTSSDGSIVNVIAKTPSLDETSKATAALQRLYIRETSFYGQLAKLISTRTPECFYVAHDDDNNFLLLLEDMAPARVVDQFDGLDFETAKHGLRQLAGLHGPTAGLVELRRASWLDGVAETLRPLYSAILPSLFQDFLIRYRELDDATTDFVRYLGENLSAFSDYTPHTACVTHGDFRTDNLLIDAQDAEVPLCVVDWQTVGVGSPMLDVAYFLTTSLSTSDREAHEDELLAFYLKELAAFNVVLPASIARAEFARYTLQPVVMLVAAAVLVERTERGDRMFLSMIDRAIRAATKWDAFAVLERRADT